MQSAGNFVVGRVELAAGVQLGKHHLQGRHPLASRDIHLVHRNAASVIGDGNRVVDVDDHVHVRRIAGQRFIDRIVHHLVDQVVQPLIAG